MMMDQRKHIVQINGYSRSFLKGNIRSYFEQISSHLHRMNGTSFWGYSLWEAPEGHYKEDDIPFTEYFIQCAGSSKAMTIEVRQEDKRTKKSKLYTLGKSENPGERNVEISLYGNNSIWVSEEEIFTADEAALIFYEYYLKNIVLDIYFLRELNFK